MAYRMVDTTADIPTIRFEIFQDYHAVFLLLPEQSPQLSQIHNPADGLTIGRLLIYAAGKQAIHQLQ